MRYCLLAYGCRQPPLRNPQASDSGPRRPPQLALLRVFPRCMRRAPGCP